MHAEMLLEKLQTENKVLFLDSLSTLSMHNDIDALKEFLHFLINKLRINGIGGIFIYSDDTSTENIKETVAMMCDKTIKI